MNSLRGSSMFDFLLTEQERSLKGEVRDFIRDDVPNDLVRDMDAGHIEYPREYVKKAAARNLLGLRFPPEYGGRGLPWSAEVVAIANSGRQAILLGSLNRTKRRLGFLWSNHYGKRRRRLLHSEWSKEIYCRGGRGGRFSCLC
jgi:alkylation response protein AidB-like acyl-CoA dehydrogenase